MNHYWLLVVWLHCLTAHPLTAQPAPNQDPVLNFKAFWQSYQDKYATFDMKQVDWQQQYEKYAPFVDHNTSPDRLFAILSDMIRPLRDAHVRLVIRGGKPTVFWPRKPSIYSNQFQFDKDSVQTYWQATNATLTRQGFEPLRAIGGTYSDSTRQFYYAKSSHYGYIRISACTYGKGGSGAKLRELDSILTYFGPIDGLLIDIRFNQGGGDRFAFGVASRFVGKGKVGCYRYRRRKRGHYTDFVKLTTFRLRPGGKKQYPQLPIALLTNDRTVSAGDILALIMHPLPTVQLIGENTEGSFDSFRFMKLPNGWFYSVPQKRFHDSENRCYEGIGVPVDSKVVMRKEDVRVNHDPIVMKALMQVTNR